MTLAVGAYSGPRAVWGAIAHPAKNATHKATPIGRSPLEVLDCNGIQYHIYSRPIFVLNQRPIETSNLILFKFSSPDTKLELFLGQMRMPDSTCYRGLFALALATLLGSCAEYGPYHANT